MSTYYFVPSRNVFGEGSVAETGHLMKSLGGTKAMIVTDEFLASNPMTTRIQAILKEAGVDSAVFGKAEPNPKDTNVVEGAFQMNTAWYFNVPEVDPVFPEQVHDYDELIGFYGSNPDDPYDLGAEMVVTIDGEEHVLTKTTMLFIPGGVPHMPLSIKRIDRPVFHFSIVMNPEYTGGGAYK